MITSFMLNADLVEEIRLTDSTALDVNLGIIFLTDI